MRMISEQIEALEKIAERLETDPELDMDILHIADFWAKDIRKAIYTIQALSSKVRENNCGSAHDVFKMDFCNVNRFDCRCGRRYINTSNCSQCTADDRKQTNADKIRAMFKTMTDEELAQRIEVNLINIDLEERFGFPCSECTEKTNCEECILAWLQSESEEV